jgi:membrane protease YdiL (CAAX protease family)
VVGFASVIDSELDPRAEQCLSAAAAIDEAGGVVASTRSRLARVPRVFFVWLALLFAVWALRSTVLVELVDARIGPLPRAVEAHLLGVFVWVLPTFYVAKQVLGDRFAEHARFFAPAGDSTRSPFRIWSESLALTAVALGAVVLFERVTSGRHVALDPAAWARLAGSMSLMPVAEELAFRGLVLTVVEKRLCVVRASLATAALFVAIRVPAWVHVAHGHAGAWDDLSSRAFTLVVLSSFLGALTVRARSIWPAVVARLLYEGLAVLLS